MLRKLVLGLGLVVLGSTLLYAKQGTVVTKDGHSYEGDVVEQGDTVQITGVAGLPGPVTVNKANVETLSYADKLADEVRAGLKKLGPKDVAARITLAKLAMQGHAYEAAHEVLIDAAKIEPDNREVSDLMLQLGPHLPAPATKPTTVPATAPVVAVKPLPPPLVAARQVTPGEINTIRQCEWRGEDDPLVKIQIKADIRNKFIDSYPDITKAEFNKMTVNQQAALILSKGKPVLFSGVQLTTDPASVAEFKKTVNQVVLHSCGNCHNGTKAGPFALSPTPNNPGVYTNFLTLQQYTVTNAGPLVDRVNPEASILLQFMLDPSLTKTPHPAKPGFKAPLRSTNAPGYQQILHWIQSLNPIVPHYGIDLTQPVVAPPAPGKPDTGK